MEIEDISLLLERINAIEDEMITLGGSPSDDVRRYQLYEELDQLEDLLLAADKKERNQLH